MRHEPRERGAGAIWWSRPASQAPVQGADDVLVLVPGAGYAAMRPLRCLAASRPCGTYSRSPLSRSSPSEKPSKRRAEWVSGRCSSPSLKRPTCADDGAKLDLTSDACCLPAPALIVRRSTSTLRRWSCGPGRFGHWDPWSRVDRATTMAGMTASDSLQDRASELVEAARAFHAAAERPRGYVAAPAALESLEEALQVLSGAWYQLAADSAPGIVERRRGRDSEAPSWPQVDGLPREQEVRLMGTLHDVAAAFAHCARACREGRATAKPIIARGAATADRQRSDAFPRLVRHERPRERAA
jgi:hypothetical protein